MKVVGYVRVSSRSQQDNSSLDAQLAAIQRECEYRGYQLAQVFKETKSASGCVERVEFDKALEYMEDEHCQGLIVFDIDRYFRSVADGLTTFKRYFSDGNYTLISVNQRFDTSSDEGWFMFTMFLVSAEFERRKIASRTKRGKEFLSAQGVCVTAEPKFQYDLKHECINGKMRRIPVENQERMAIIDRVKRLRQSGSTLLEIAETLNRDEIKTKRGCEWTPKQVSRLLV